jgi:phosphatidate cytidylyltransferase
MTVQSEIFLLAAGTLILLVVASIAGLLMRWRWPGNESVANFNSRTISWWVIAGLLALALWVGNPALVVLFAAASAVALYEYLAVTDWRTHDLVSVWLAFAVVLPIQYVLVWAGSYGIFVIFIPVYAFTLLAIVSALRGRTKLFTLRVAEFQWGLLLCVYCLSYAPALVLIEIPEYQGRSAMLVAFLLIVAQSSDVLQYIWGRLAGRHKIAPTLSPSKTVEGTLGGIASASLIGTGLFWITPFAPWQAALISLVIASLGFLGGLVMSAVKRDQGVKDWGHVVPGHGGVLDRLDSVIFAAPIFFHLTRFWWG